MWNFGNATVSFQVSKIILGNAVTVYFRCLIKNLHESWFEEYKHFNIQDKPKLKYREKTSNVPGNSETICLGSSENGAHLKRYQN